MMGFFKRKHIASSPKKNTKVQGKRAQESKKTAVVRPVMKTSQHKTPKKMPNYNVQKKKVVTPSDVTKNWRK